MTYPLIALSPVLLILGLLALYLSCANNFGYIPELWRKVLGYFGYDIRYIARFTDKGLDQVWDYRYDSIDFMMGRPVHEKMSVAPPWAKRTFVKRGKK